MQVVMENIIVNFHCKKMIAKSFILFYVTTVSN